MLFVIQIVDKMKVYNDPRITEYFLPIVNGTLAGQIIKINQVEMMMILEKLNFQELVGALLNFG